MAGRTGRSGGGNRTRSLGEWDQAGVRAGPWPWERARKPWKREKIYDYLRKWLAERKLTREESSRDVVRQLANGHWRAVGAYSALDDGEDEFFGRPALTEAKAADAAILSAWRALGVLPHGRREEGDGDEVEDFS